MSEQGLVIDPDEPTGQPAPIQPAVDAGPPVIPQEAVEDTAAPPGEDEDPEVEAEAVTVQGGRYVPVAAVKDARKAAAEAKKAAKAEADARQAAEAQLTQVAQWVQENKPYIELLRNNPDLLKPRQPEPAAPPAGPQKPTVDPRAERIAKRLSLYKADGELDLEAATEVLAVSKELAAEQVAERIQPIERSNQVEQAKRNIERLVLETKDGNGQPISTEAWRQVLTPFKEKPELLTNPDVLELVKVTAAGVQALRTKPPQVTPPTKPPVYTEPSGGAGVGAVPPNPLQATFAKKWGVTPQKVAAMAAKYDPSLPAQLED